MIERKLHKRPIMVDENGYTHYDERKFQVFRSDFERDGFSKWINTGLRPILSGTTKLNTLRYLSSKGFLFIKENGQLKKF